MKTAEQVKQSLLAYTAEYVAAKKPTSWSQGTEKNPGAHAYCAAGWLKREFGLQITADDAPAFREAIRILSNASAFGQELDKLNKDENSAFYGKFRIGTENLLSELE